MVKELLVGTCVGRSVAAARSWYEIARAMYSAPEIIGETASEHLAATLVARICLPGKCFVDVGAHIGAITADVLNVAKARKVIAIEAIKEKASSLKRRFPSADIHQCAAGETDGEARFFIANDSGFSSLGKIDGGTEIRVPVKRLDSIITDSDIDVIKIDVEGAELGVIRGAERIVSNCRPTIMFESGAPQNDGLGYQSADLWRWFTERNYEIVVPNRMAHTGPSLSLDGFAESHFYPRRTNNYFAIAAERRADVRERAWNVLHLTKPQSRMARRFR